MRFYRWKRNKQNQNEITHIFKWNEQKPKTENNCKREWKRSTVQFSRFSVHCCITKVAGAKKCVFLRAFLFRFVHFCMVSWNVNSSYINCRRRTRFFTFFFVFQQFNKCNSFICSVLCASCSVLFFFCVFRFISVYMYGVCCECILFYCFFLVLVVLFFSWRCHIITYIFLINF